MLLEVNNLNYEKFDNFNIKFEDNRQYSIIGNLKSGNEVLFKILSTFIMTNDVISFNNNVLNYQNRLKYIRRIGVIREVNDNLFITDNVLDELRFSLEKVNINDDEINKRINFFLKYFNLRIKTKLISELTIYEKQLLLVIIGLITEPKVVLIEDIYCNLRLEELKRLNKLLSYLSEEENMTIIKFMNSFDYANKNDYIYLMDNYEIIKEGNKDDILNDTKFINDHDLRVPFMYDLSDKLKMYKLIDKVYLNMEDMVNDIWK